jgi:murein DD-endopeptidase MepM/ murein hydrolase activator NlpD
MKGLILFLFFITLPFYLIISLYFLDKVYFLCPVDYQADIIVRHDSRGEGSFGARRNGNRLHSGIDLFAEIGAPVRAARSGKVIAARGNRGSTAALTRGGMGNFIVLRHAHGITTVYCHLWKTYVSSHQSVRQGQIIGTVGKTGNANYRDIQPHLHFEVRKDGIPQDPLEYLE